ncbi:hypothetical protein [Leptospira ilyithenensis]|uniref:Porin n=1 Tax=Leptospira ilyithenensis TaxID=2484901 RepID=A0A4R9LQ97_9LEPT|nr:hypothetical protein [Leptospira ilyithenensis]TGN09795.1 hypothetical protein EHS11_12010 [Leptospira ilyithenensis]
MKFLFLLLSISFLTPLFAQAGKAEGDTLRFKTTVLSGSYNSDWEPRNRAFQALYNGTLEDNWNHKNKTHGGKLGVDYYTPLYDNLFSHLLFGINFSAIGGKYPMSRYGQSQVHNGKYSGGYRQVEITFGTVIDAYRGLRIIPKFVHRSLTQSLKNEVDSYLFSATSMDTFSGKEIYKSNATLGYFGLGLEYDLSPNLTVYFDSLLYSNLLVQSNGKYQAEIKTQGFLSSADNSANTLMRHSYSEGNYKVSGNRFLIGMSFKISDSFQFFITTERDTIRTKISNPIGTNVTGMVSSASLGFDGQMDVVNKTLYEKLLYTRDQRIISTTTQLGVAKDFYF